MLVRWTPFPQMNDLQSEMNRVFENYSRSGSSTETGAAWAPVVDVYEDENNFVLHAELPGLSKDDVELHLENRSLTIRGERKLDKSFSQANFHQQERFLGRFARTFTLPPTISQEKITANFKDGVLEVVLPKAEELRPKLIPVHSA